MDISALGKISLQDSTDKPTPLGGLWADRPVVLVFARHFG